MSAGADPFALGGTDSLIALGAEHARLWTQLGDVPKPENDETEAMALACA
jgi:hypothetical protein